MKNNEFNKIKIPKKCIKNPIKTKKIKKNKKSNKN